MEFELPQQHFSIRPEKRKKNTLMVALCIVTALVGLAITGYYFRDYFQEDNSARRNSLVPNDDEQLFLIPESSKTKTPNEGKDSILFLSEFLDLSEKLENASFVDDMKSPEVTTLLKPALQHAKKYLRDGKYYIVVTNMYFKMSDLQTDANVLKEWGNLVLDLLFPETKEDYVSEHLKMVANETFKQLKTHTSGHVFLRDQCHRALEAIKVDISDAMDAGRSYDLIDTNHRILEFVFSGNGFINQEFQDQIVSALDLSETLKNLEIKPQLYAEIMNSRDVAFARQVLLKLNVAACNILLEFRRSLLETLLTGILPHVTTILQIESFRTENNNKSQYLYEPLMEFLITMATADDMRPVLLNQLENQEAVFWFSRLQAKGLKTGSNVLFMRRLIYMRNSISVSGADLIENQIKALQSNQITDDLEAERLRVLMSWVPPPEL